MKKIFALSFALVLTLSSAAQMYNQRLEAHRDSINKEFSDFEISILLSEDVETFHGLDYFMPNSDFRVNAKFKRIKNGKEFEMPTSTDRMPVYKPYGKLKFKIDGKKYKLTLYQNVELTKREGYEDYLFLPFNDMTNGVESYGGGRYLDMKIGDLDFPVIDFNYCYNAYCAYNHKYSCPIPPDENYLKVRIEAGVKKYH
jgi:hypothetical protein